MDRSIAKMIQFKRGSIVQLELKNFMIYENVIFNPGPFLNLILGPNGSGKSAIVCAIIMGFGGDPQITGRSSNLIDYVRFGSHNASISIELYSGSENERNMIIQRQLRIVSKNAKNECTNTWKLNGKTVNKQDITKFITDLNIDINNLCQVLPQERVVEFSRLSPKELLVSTEKSIGDEHMYERHMKLISISSELADMQQRIKNCNAFIMKFQNFKSNIEPDLKLIRQKKKFEEEIQWLVKKKAWVDFEDKRTQYNQLKAEYIQMRDEHQTCLEQLKPIKARIESCEKFYKQLLSNKNRSSSVLKQACAKITELNSKLDGLQEKAKAKSFNYEEEVKKQKLSKTKLAQYEKDLVNFQNELANSNNQEQYENKLEETKREIEEMDEQLRKLGYEINEKNLVIERLEHNQRRLNAEKRSISDLFKRRIEKIAEHDNSIITACEWLDKNRDKFNGEIFHPIITQINLKSAEYAPFVESAIGFNDMSTFLFEQNDDLKKFCELLDREHQTRVNVAMLPRNFSIENCRRSFNLGEYESFGIFNSVRDLFTAPDKVMVYLCKTYRLNDIPVGNDTTDREIQHLLDLGHFRRIITPKNVYHIVVSSYDRAKTTRISPLGEARILTIHFNQANVDKVVQEMKKNDKTIQELQTFITNSTRKKAELGELWANKKQELDSSGNIQRAISLLESKIAEKQRQIKLVRDSLDLYADSKRKVSEDLAVNQAQQMKVLNEVSSLIKQCAQNTADETISSSKIKIVKNALAIYQNNFSSINKEAEFIKKQVHNLNETCRKGRDAARDARDRALEITGFDLAASNVEESLSQKFKELPSTIPDIDDCINILKLRCKGVAEIDESILEDYKKYTREISEKQAESNELEAELITKENEITTLKPLWLDSLKSLIEKINQNFSKFMEHLQFSGEVYLFEGKDYAFEDYGIRIKVKFRDSEPMKDLDAYHQSGGERSVSTMIYMLSLQELAHVPFRVVDEINQGMDERNERCVFDLISEVSRRNSSQYFLLSPKLLTKLNYTPEMTVHIIFNGPKVYVDWAKVLPKLTQKKEITAS